MYYFCTDMTEYKKAYSAEELREIENWFQQREESLPAELHIGKEMFIPDLKHTLKIYLENAKLHRDNPTFSGQTYLLFRIRDLLENTQETPQGEN